MVVAAYVKDPNAIQDFPIDWVLDAGDTITASTWAVPAGVTKGDGANGAPAPTFTTTKTVVWLLGGTVGETYLVVNHVTTAQGRQHDQTLIILVLER